MFCTPSNGYRVSFHAVAPSMPTSPGVINQYKTTAYSTMHNVMLRWFGYVLAHSHSSTREQSGSSRMSPRGPTLPKILSIFSCRSWIPDRLFKLCQCKWIGDYKVRGGMLARIAQIINMQALYTLKDRFDAHGICKRTHYHAGKIERAKIRRILHGQLHV